METEVRKYEVTCPSSHSGKMSQDMDLDLTAEHVLCATVAELEDAYGRPINSAQGLKFISKKLNHF